MKAILINPQDKTVTEVDYSGEYKQIYKLIDAMCFDAVRINGSETIYVDDEGLINNKGETVGFFYVKGQHPIALAGKGLVLATDSRGKSIATSFTVPEVEAMIDWVIPARINGVLCWLGDQSIYRMMG